ncbi:MAG: hypothetical protein ACYC7L_05530 [Nitrospirota bacterium]
MKIIILMSFILACLCLNSFSESIEPPPARDGRIAVPATLKTDPILNVNIGKFKAKFEKTTLGEILKTVGVGTIHHAGDAGGSQYWLCYTLPNQRVWLISNGEMGGSDHVLTQVQAISTKQDSLVNTSCPQIPTPFQTISMNFGWIGTTQESLIRVLGQPSGKDGGRFKYLYEGKEPGVSDGQKMEWDVLSFLEVTIANNEISSVYASHVTSY